MQQKLLSFSLCVCAYVMDVHLSTHVCVCGVCMFACVEYVCIQKQSWHWVSFSIALPLVNWSRLLHLNPELIDLASLCSDLLLGSYVWLFCGGITDGLPLPSIYMGDGNWYSCPHGCFASALPRESAFQPSFYFPGTQFVALGNSSPKTLI